MGTSLSFKTKQEAEQSEVFKSKNFSRFLRDMREEIEKPFILEIVDFGTHLSHHDFLKSGNLIKW
jgi:hypothetical protein